jgi:hypothetical protein
MRKVLFPVIDILESHRDGGVSLEVALHHRRSIRDFSNAALTLGEVGQLL